MIFALVETFFLNKFKFLWMPFLNYKSFLVLFEIDKGQFPRKTDLFSNLSTLQALCKQITLAKNAQGLQN